MINTNKGNTILNGSITEIKTDITCIIDSFIKFCKDTIGMEKDAIYDEIDFIVKLAKKPAKETENDINDLLSLFLEKFLEKYTDGREK